MRLVGRNTMKVLLFTCIVCVLIPYTVAVIITELHMCPPDCSTKFCWRHAGCSQCRKGFCLQMNEKHYGICKKSCPTGNFCNKDRVCSKCRMRNCKRCHSTYTCRGCKMGYTYFSKRSSCLKVFTFRG